RPYLVVTLVTLICVLFCCRSRRSYLRDFFFSSRRRHTRFSRDWSSDVCSSDLSSRITDVDVVTDLMIHDIDLALYLNGPARSIEIGRASCRERVLMSAEAGAGEKKPVCSEANVGGRQAERLSVAKVTRY